MSRQTAFPGVLLESIKVEKPPFDEPGVIQEFVGRGATASFDNFPDWKEVSPTFIETKLEELEEMIGPLRDTFKMRYNLLVRAPSIPTITDAGVAKNVQKRTVSTRSRAYVRAKNPFEPDILEVGEPSIDKKMSEDGSIDIYRVPVWVTK